jgi:hypothetical protein
MPRRILGHDAPVSIVSIDERPEDQAPTQRGGLPLSLIGTRTPLAADLNEIQATWLLDHACEQWELLYGSTADWRADMDRWEEMSKEDYTSRIGRTDPNKPDSRPDVFAYQNDTLGMAAGFWDFYNAQARNDIFGTEPWLSAAAEGRADSTLAELITRHSQWKLHRSNLEEVAKDAINVAGWGGTAFVKARWHREEETFKRFDVVAHSTEGGKPIIHPQTGDFIRDKAAIEALGMDGAEVFWKGMTVEETKTVYDNTLNTLLHHSDVAFDATAPALDLFHTDVFARFRMGILDAASLYGLEEEQMNDLRMCLAGTDEQAGPRADATSGIFEFEDNPIVSLVEGFIRCDPFQTGKPIRLHVIFSPAYRILFNVDYLANVTPEGMLPVVPVRIHKEAGKICGMGWFQKYENANNAVDRQYNAVTKRNAESSSVISGLQPDALADKSQAKNFKMDPTKPLTLAPGKTITEALSFTAIPDVNERSVDLMNQMLQMNQMRSGITSAAQGELKGVPNASTATGVRDLQSRGAILLKSQIDEATTDVERLVEYNVLLIYANQDHDETFAWGEGTSTELLEIKAGDVKGLRMNVTLTLVQAQNAQKLQNAQAAISLFMQWIQVPEPEKPAARAAFVQAIASLGFRNAEDIIRKAAVDPAGVLALIPPEMAPIVEQAFVSAGLMAGPETPPPTETPAAAPPEATTATTPPQG